MRSFLAGKWVITRAHVCCMLAWGSFWISSTTDLGQGQLHFCAEQGHCLLTTAKPFARLCPLSRCCLSEPGGCQLWKSALSCAGNDSMVSNNSWPALGASRLQQELQRSRMNFAQHCAFEALHRHLSMAGNLCKQLHRASYKFGFGLEPVKSAHFLAALLWPVA